jgi:pyruvate,water dikinase
MESVVSWGKRVPSRVRRGSNEMEWLIPFTDDRALDAGLVGRKFAALAQAERAGFKVPEAFAVGVEAHRHFREHSAWPDGLPDEVRQAADALDLERGVSVRSSSPLEDLASKSFAGQYESYLDIRDARGLEDAVEACWKSAETEKVRAYLRDESDEDHLPLLALILQRMVHAGMAGVAFSRDPMRPAGESSVIESVSGLGDRLVSGAATPDRFFVDADGVVRTDAGTIVPEAEPWRSIAGMARGLESLFDGRIQDIEWALDDQDTLWLLQARPATAVREPDSAAPPGAWTRSIANDLWADRLTPFMADVMTRNASRFDLSAYARFLGIPVERPTLSVVHGYLYVNCNSLKQVLRWIPRRLRTHEIRSLFPPGWNTGAVPPPRPFGRVLFFCKALWLSVTYPGSHPLLCALLSRRFLRRLDGRIRRIEGLPGGDEGDSLEKLRAALGCLLDLLSHNQWPYLHATLFTWAARWLAVDHAGLTHADFLTLLGRGSDNVTAAMERSIQALADRIRSDEDLLEQFLNRPPEARIQAMPPDLRAQLDRFLETYGSRAQQRTLSAERWSESPEQVLGMLAVLVRNRSKVRSGKGGRTEEAARMEYSALPFRLRALLRVSLRLARQYLDLREELRFALDRILFLLRRSLLEIGRRNGMEADLLFLRPSEVERTVTGGMPLEDAKALAARRRTACSEGREPPPFYVDGIPVQDLDPDAETLRGIGTSPGRATGRARIVDDPTRAEIEQGDIMVARSTDPGWTPILRMVGGIVVEEGALLNHCSIVARELGLPAVVGVRNATSLIPEHTTVTVDGGLGVVQLEGENHRGSERI